MMYPLIGAGLTAAARVASGEYEIPEKAQEHLKKATSKAERWSSLFKDLDPKNPVSWGRTAVKVASELANSGKDYEHAWDWLDDHGYMNTPGNTLNYFLPILMNAGDKKAVFINKLRTLYLLKLPNGPVVCLMRRSGHVGEPSEFNIFVNYDGYTIEDVYAGVASFVWKYIGSIRLDYENSKPRVSPLNLDCRRSFYGPQKELISRLRGYREEGVRRNVLLHGKHGTGKTTLAYEAARELSERTIEVTQEFAKKTSVSTWGRIMQNLRPDAVVMNDVDRINDLGKRLQIFEEGYSNVPLILMTSNHLNRIPDAMLRPGRIDMVVKVDPPRGEYRSKVLDGLARDCGVTIPEGRWEELERMICYLTPSHVRECLLRAKTEGWDSEKLHGDITFEIEEEKQKEEVREKSQEEEG